MRVEANERTEANKAVVRRFYENYAGHTDDSLDELLSPDLQVHGHTVAATQDREGHKRVIRMWNEAFSDTRYAVEEQVAEGDAVATRVRLQATHDRGAFMDIAPTGKTVALWGISIERVRDGRIVQRRVAYDSAVLMRQLGLLPPSDR